MNKITALPITIIPKAASAPVNWREVTIFSLLAYGLSWAVSIPIVMPQLRHVFSTGTAPDVTQGPSLDAFTLTMFGPMIAALVMRLFVSKDGLKGTLGAWRSWKYYLAAVGSPALFGAVLILFNHMTGLGRYVWPASQPPLWLVYPLSILLNAVLKGALGLSEEYGWRGYLLPRLLPLGENKGTIVLGLIWAFWHLPFVLSGLNYPGQHPLLSVLVFTGVVVILSFPFTWLYTASRGSAFIVGVFHVTLNVVADHFTGTQFIPGGNPLLVYGLGLISGIFLLTLVVIVYGVLKRPTHADVESIQPQMDGTWRDWLR
jgi:hypothetical protein